MSQSRGYTEDGVQYTEHQIKEMKTTAFQWATHSSSRRFRTSSADSSKIGSATLLAIALKTVVKHRQSLNAEILEGVPWEPLGRILWKEIKRNKGDTLEIWKSFLVAYRFDKDASREISDFSVPNPLPPNLLPSAIPLMQPSPNSCQFLSTLAISVSSIDLSLWVDLCGIRNLRTLFVAADTADQLRFNDVVGRAWSNHVTEAGAFPFLRYILLYARFRSKSMKFPGKSLRYFSTLPQLQWLWLYPMSLSWEKGEGDANQFGWSEIDNVNFQMPHNEADLSNAAILTAHLDQTLAKGEKESTMPRIAVKISDDNYQPTWSSCFQLSCPTTLFREHLSSSQYASKRGDEGQPSESRVRKIARKDISTMLSEFMP